MAMSVSGANVLQAARLTLQDLICLQLPGLQTGTHRSLWGNWSISYRSLHSYHQTEINILFITFILDLSMNKNKVRIF